jgi:hypothetical protein
MKSLVRAVALTAALFASSAVYAVPLLSLQDFIIPIDTDPPILTTSSYPAGEAPIFAFDFQTTSKYLNFGEQNSGLIVTPGSGASTLRSIVFTTANDAVERDPTSYKVWGTNDPITSTDNMAGPNPENWSLISEGTIVPPMERFTPAPAVSFANSTAYTSYRITFPTVRNTATANSMQVSEIAMFQNADGVSDQIFIDGFVDPVLAILLEPISTFNSSSPANEQAPNVLDRFGPDPANGSQSTHPAAEGPINLADANTATKYFNTGGDNSGFIVTPSGGASTVRSFVLSTANDVPDRDPTTWEIYGTNDAIVSTNNSFGTAENWTLVDSGDIALPPDRLTVGPIVTVDNTTSYTSYKMQFPTRLGPGNGMQISDAGFFASTNGTGTNLLTPTSTFLAIDPDARSGEATKYLNFGENNSGFIVTPAAGQTIITSFQITTANDAEVRDPASYILYGTNDPITSAAHTNGSQENWVQIAQGDLTLPPDRLTQGEVVTFTNTTAYRSYRMVFPTVKDETAANSMQIAGVSFDGTVVGGGNPADFNNDGSVNGADLTIWRNAYGTNALGDADDDGDTDGNDFMIWQRSLGSSGVGAVPEPSVTLLAIAAVAGGAGAVRRASRRRMTK